MTTLSTLEFGLDTFGDVTDSAAGTPLSHAQVIRNLVDEAVLADQIGLDFIGVGEHHRPDFAVSAPEVVLAAMAARTGRIHLGSAVTVLSSDDPVRVFQRFATVDALSSGRAEVILGRGSFTESFPLFGYDLQQYEALFEEKLDLFAALLEQKPVTWQGRLRASLHNQSVYPAVERGTLKTWVGVGGSPESVVRAARYDFPLMLAIIGGDPRRFAPYVDLYHRAFAQFGRPVQPVGVHSPGYVAKTDEQAREEFWPGFKANRDRIGKERGWPSMRREERPKARSSTARCMWARPRPWRARSRPPCGCCGPAAFSSNIRPARTPHETLMRGIELYGREVVPMVRDMLAADRA